MHLLYSKVSFWAACPSPGPVKQPARFIPAELENLIQANMDPQYLETADVAAPRRSEAAAYLLSIDNVLQDWIRLREVR